MGRKRRLPAEPFELDIGERLANGLCSARHEDMNLQVHDAVEGERVMARHLFGRRFRGQAAVFQVLEPAPERVEPRCTHHGICSACSLQHLNLKAQIGFKQDLMLAQLRDRAGLTPGEVLPPLQADAWHYRRKARLSVRWVKARERVLVGFRERDGRFVLDMAECHVLPERVAEQIGPLCETIGLMEARERIPQVEVTCGDEECALVIRHLDPLSGGDLECLRSFARASGLQVLLQPGGPESVAALWPAEGRLSYALPAYDLEFGFRPQDFIQVNAALNQRMIGQALDLLAPATGERYLDLFCGLGNFSLPLAQRCATVTGAEGDAGLVGQAIANAGRNGIGNVDFVQADLYTPGGLATLPAGPFDGVLLDPPRSGAGPAIETIAACGAGKVLYVSCNPATMAEDAGVLVTRHGFRLAAAGVMDMFPHTMHVESMALFERI